VRPLNPPATARPTLPPTASADKLAAIDRQLLELLAERCDIVRSMEPFAFTNESSVALDSLAASVPRKDAAQWLRHASSIAVADRHRLQVAYLGPEYSYSHLATIKVFGDAYPVAAVSTIAAVFDSILRGDSAAGIVPIENSTDGRVVDTLGMFVKVNVKIVGEVLLPIHHNLLSCSPRESITEVYSKPQALSQCRGWLANHLPKARLIEISSTAAAAELAASKPGAAAVASIEAGRQYALNVIDASIEDNANNVTRFAILGRDYPPATGNDKTAILFQVEHRPGALADAMLLFKDAGLNLTWIESFPLPGTNAEYLFFVETVGHVTEPKIAGALERLKAITLRLDVLGSYAKASAID
jgi:chorismate mutase / prephenate dehydratase